MGEVAAAISVVDRLAACHSFDGPLLKFPTDVSD
jgi:hypothetical protein